MMRIIGQLTVFFLMGCVLHFIQFSIFPSERINPKVITIASNEIVNYTNRFVNRMDRQPAPIELQNFIDTRVQELLLIEEAFRLELHLKDPVVQERINKNLTFLDLPDKPQLADTSLYNEMIRNDLVIQRRLLERITALIMSESLNTEVLPGELYGYYQSHRENYLSPKRYRIKHAYWPFKGEKKDSEPIQFYDQQAKITALNMQKLLPAGLVDEINRLVKPAELKPYRNKAGEHRVTVLEIIPPQALSYNSVQSKVKQDFLQHKKQQAVIQYISELKPFYWVKING